MKHISTVGRTKEILDKHHFKFKKSLGQNFLIDSNVIKEIIHKADINENTGVIEVGPGIGSLTEHLAISAKKVLAFEIDQRLIPVLDDTLSAYDNVTVINEDILEADVPARIKEYLSDCDDIVVVANLPYYITTPILMNFLTAHLPISRYYVMMQKEVGERISASPNSKAYGSLSIAIDYYTEAKTVQNVPRTVFMPPPNVDSIIVELKTRPQRKIEVDDEDTFFKLTRGAFIHRRKTILNNYQTLFADGKQRKDEIRALFEEAGIEPVRRGESLSLEDYKEIYDAFKKSDLVFA